MKEKTVTNAKLDNFSEMENILSVKSSVNERITALFGSFGLGNLLRHLSMEKREGVSAATLILALCLFRINGTSIFAAYSNRFYGLLNVGKNCFYRMMLRPGMDWRRLLAGVVCRFYAILRKKKAELHEEDRCYIIDDTTIEKTGTRMERVSRVFDHVKGRCVLGFKLLLLAVTDGVTTLPVDFSLHRERGKKGDCGLSGRQRGRQYKALRKKGSTDGERVRESDYSKIDMAVSMLQAAWKRGIRAGHVLTDSWFTHEVFISAVRKIGHGAIHCVGLAKMDGTKYLVGGRLRNAHELVAICQRDARKQKKYKCLCVVLRGKLGGVPVKIFLVKYGRNETWNILLSTDTDMKFNRAMELYGLRWSIEVLFKECKSYLGLGKYQGRDFNGQIADCTLCFVTYCVVALGKRFSDYETMGELYRSERDQLLALTLWHRLLDFVKAIMDCLSDVLGLDPNQIVQAMMSSDETARKLALLVSYATHKLPQDVGKAA